MMRNLPSFFVLPILAFAGILPGGVAAGAEKEPPNAVDHAGIIQSWDEESFEQGKTIYQNLCTNCHGADGITPPLPQARAFTSGELKFGSDPYAMFLTLTNGNGIMGPQTWMEPYERYAVIHYIRETFLRDRDDFEEVHDGYLEELPTVNVVVKESDKVERNFGPALASQLDREFSSVLSVKLPGETTISYNLHRMDQAGLWRGGFLNLLNTQHYRERGGGVAMPEGEMVAGLQKWRWAHGGSFEMSEEELLPRRPLATDKREYHGHYLKDDRIILSYSIDGREVLEMPGAAPRFGAVLHAMRFGPGRSLKLSVGGLEEGLVPLKGFIEPDAKTFEAADAGRIAVMGMNTKEGLKDFVCATLLGDAEGFAWSFDEENRLVLEIPESKEERVVQVVRFAGKGDGTLLSFASYVRSREAKGNVPDPGKQLEGGELRWPEELVTSVERGEDDQAYALDTIGVPPNDGENPWNVWFRTSALAFFPDGRMVISTHGGDVWIVSGLGENEEELKWKRFAAGMYEPFGLLVIDDLVYVTCKDRLTRLHDLNGDGEADFYESFFEDPDVSTFFHAFNFDLQRDKEGNLYYAKAGQYTSYEEPGTIMKVSPDGTKGEIYCRGFRTPNGMGMMPDGRPTVSDNQGTWMPASKVSLCEPGGFYGYVQTASSGDNWSPDGGRIDHTKVVPPKTFDQPLIWMPQAFDNSSGGQLFVEDERWGPLAGKLLHTSFGKGWLYYMMVQDFGDTAQAGIVKLDLDCETGIHRAQVNPADGQVYATGLNGWNGNGRPGLSQGGIHRYRYTGAEAKLLTDVRVEKGGIRLVFNFALSPEALGEVERYELMQWNYLWASKYGSEHYSLEEEWEPGEDEVEIEDVVPGDGGKEVFLKIPGLKPVNQVEINLDLVAADGTEFEEQAYLTINKVPGGEHPNMKEEVAGRAVLWKKLEEEQKRKAAEKAAAKKRKQEAAKKKKEEAAKKEKG